MQANVIMNFISSYIYEVWSKKITIIWNFFKKCLFINNYLVLFQVTPLRYKSLMLAFFPILETLLKCAFWYCQQLLFRFFFYLFNRSKIHSFHRFTQFWKEQKVSGCQVRWIRGWGMITVLFLAKNSGTSIDAWAGALAWCKIYDWFFHNSMRFWRIASRNRRINSRQY